MNHRHGRSWKIPFSTLTPVAIAIVLLGAGGCASTKMELITVAADGKGFVEQRSGGAFIPFGTNYYDPNTGWAPNVWQQFDPDRVTLHFDIMKKLGINCARVFLAATTFQPDVNTVDEQALDKLDKLIDIARDARIRLILTGPDHWEGRPAYWEPDRFAGRQALAALEHFWNVVGQRYQGEATILAWDLLNEPQMPWFVEGWEPEWNAWLRAKYGDGTALKAAWADELAEEEKLGAIQVPKNTADRDNLRLLDWQLFRESLADEWVRRQVATLREADPTHPITIGYIQWSYPPVRPGDPGLYAAFNPRRQAQWLDFVCIHFYPLLGRPFGSRANWETNLLYLQSILAYCQTGKAVVLGEYGWYGGGAPQGRPYLSEGQQARWLAAEVEASRRLAQGWLSWPFADTPESTDMSIYGGLVTKDMIRKVWGWRFKSFVAALPEVPQPTPELPTFDFTPSLTAPLDDLLPIHEQYAETVRTALQEAGPVQPIKQLPRIENPTAETAK